MYYKDLINSIKKEDISNFNYLIKYKYKFNEEILNNNERVDKNIISSILKDLDKSKTYPIQYIVGNVDFYGYIYKVNKNVLIPRFETEELVENTISLIKEMFNKRISLLDLCTGSGCIGITLKKELDIDVTLSDISLDALEVAKENSKDLDIKIIHSDLLSNIKEKYDVIISNPPYIRKDEIIMDIVKNNEPNIALYADDNGLYYYEEILKNINKNLNKQFLIAFEIGEKQAEAISNIAYKYLDNIRIIVKKDMQERDRMLFIMNKIK